MLKYEWGRYRNKLYKPPPPPAKFTAGIARCLPPQHTATFKYRKVPIRRPRQCARRSTGGRRPVGHHERIDLSDIGDERQREFNRAHEGVERSARNCSEWFDHPWLTGAWDRKDTEDLGWRTFEKPYKMGYVEAVMVKGGRAVLADRLMTVLPGAVRVGRTKKDETAINSEASEESEESEESESEDHE